MGGKRHELDGFSISENGQNSGQAPNEAPPPPYTEMDIDSTNLESSDRSTPAAGDRNSSQYTSCHARSVFTPPRTPSGSTGRSAVQAFFQSRQPPSPAAQTFIEHPMTVRLGCTVYDFPHRVNFLGRDVSELDWLTFLNFLIPDPAAPRGSEAARAEQEMTVRWRPAPTSSDASSHAAGPRYQQLQGPSAAAFPDEGSFASHAEATVEEWNAHFFGPRSISVRLVPPEFFKSLYQQPPEPMDVGVGRLRLGENGMRYGNGFTVDGKGMRLGGVLLNSSGVSLNQQTEQPAKTTQPIPHQTAPQSYYTKPSHLQENSSQGPSTTSTPHGDSAVHREEEEEDFDSDVDVDIGSVPQHDDLKIQQLPLYIARLQEWLAAPETLRTKSDVRRFREELKAAKRDPPPPGPDPKTLKADAKAARARWKELMKQQRGVRKALREEGRARRKEAKKAGKEARRAGATSTAPAPPGPLNPYPQTYYYNDNNASEPSGSGLPDGQGGVPPPTSASTELHRVANQLESDVARKQAALARIQEGPRRAALEAEVEALATSLRTLRLRATAAAARDSGGKAF
ncbi:hypothetical protein S7711_00076 [Stachybotrys chartarum IBT 7711]|uniref:Uncharacterized protein n=1 Tax=Stachybotrys chartarum (strain CBS 109288 / IBT 7711) TaxID=1280523 RepID=A0A084B3D0_STACB|nr:hypothetical protein S7711_00076 [Stachybotrys chartarum IBT 7711]